MDELKELLTKILGLVSEDLTLEGIADQMQSHSHSLWQVMFNVGHKKATAELTPKITTLNDRVTELEGENTKSLERIDELQKDKPDLEAIQATHQKTVTDLQTKHEKELGEANASIAQGNRERGETEIADALRAVLHDGYAKMRAHNLIADKRIVFNDKDGTYQIMQKDAPTIPIQSNGSTTAAQILAQEELSSADAEWHLSGVGTGPGAKDGLPAGQQGTKGLVEKIGRQAEKFRNKSKERTERMKTAFPSE